MLLWKGDTADAPSGSSNPEGSDEHPGRECTRDTNRVADDANGPVRGPHESPRDGVRAGVNVLPEPWNNQHAVLADVDEEHFVPVS